jgi:hypothetical protein
MNTPAPLQQLACSHVSRFSGSTTRSPLMRSLALQTGVGQESPKSSIWNPPNNQFTASSPSRRSLSLAHGGRCSENTRRNEGHPLMELKAPGTASARPSKGIGGAQGRGRLGVRCQDRHAYAQQQGQGRQVVTGHGRQQAVPSKSHPQLLEGSSFLCGSFRHCCWAAALLAPAATLSAREQGQHLSPRAYFPQHVHNHNDGQHCSRKHQGEPTSALLMGPHTSTGAASA